MYEFQFDERSLAQLNVLYKMPELYQQQMHDPLAEDLSKAAMEYFKPMLHVRPQHTGALEQSIKPAIVKSSDGWEVSYNGLFYGLYMDDGNFPANQVLRAEDYGLKAFPVDRRLGNTKFQKTIHGMGAIHAEAPTHYSAKTVQWLADGKASEIGQEHLWKFLNEVVMP